MNWGLIAATYAVGAVVSAVYSVFGYRTRQRKWNTEVLGEYPITAAEMFKLWWTTFLGVGLLIPFAALIAWVWP